MAETVSGKLARFWCSRRGHRWATYGGRIHADGEDTLFSCGRLCRRCHELDDLVERLNRTVEPSRPA